METQMLRDPEIFPSETVLKEALGETVFTVLSILLTTITSDEYRLTYEWRYYKDGKAWLCKVVYNKNTIFWLSIWENIFKVSFYFTEKHLKIIETLDIEESILNTFITTKPIGRLIPMTFNVSKQEQLKDLLTIVRFKKSSLIKK